MSDDLIKQIEEALGKQTGLGESKPVAVTASGAPADLYDATKYENNEEIERAWAMKAFKHAETYFGIIQKVNPKILKLTPIDDEIYDTFRESFPNLTIANIPERLLKAPDAKEKWREFCNKFEKKVEDFNFGTLLRLDAAQEYSEENTIFVTRIQFYAIEIARNREGINNVHFNS